MNLPASDLAEYVSRGIGSGGGHINKAGGMIMKQMLAKQYPQAEIEEVLRKRLQQYISEAVC